jgi:hypothetical protein
MTYFPKFAIELSDSPSVDAFARMRVSTPVTTFNSKQLHDKLPQDWDEEIGGTGATSVHSVNKATTAMAVSATTAGSVIRQTLRCFNYQPGKSQLIMLTGNMNGLVAGVTKQVGLFTDNNGLFFEFEAAANVVIRSKASGSVVDTKIAQSAWNLDKMDGTGPSGVTLDFTKIQLFVIDFEWLGTGRVRYGFFVGGSPVYCHEALHANNIDTVYMSTPNLPIRYAIENDGSGAATSLDHVCSTVISEGGVEPTGRLYSVDSGITGLSLGSNVVNAIIGMRLASNAPGAVIDLVDISVLGEASKDVLRVQIIRDPVVAGELTWDTATFPSVDVVIGTPGTNTVTGGEVLFTVVGAGRTSLQDILPPPRTLLGSRIDGTVQTVFLVVTALGGAAVLRAAQTWREIS